MRAAKSQWSVSPETIMTHHFRLAKGIPSVVDSSPPYSMYNSPSSVHYVLKTRASSADSRNRRPLSKSQRELETFVGRNKFDRPPLPNLQMHSLVKPKLLSNPNYQPPRRMQSSPKVPQIKKDYGEASSSRFMKITKFKNDVLSDIIRHGVYTDRDIINVIRTHKENNAGVVPWNDLESASLELFEELEVKNRDYNQNFSEKRKSSSFKKLHGSLDLSSLSSSGSSSKSSSSTGSSSSSTGISSLESV